MSGPKTFGIALASALIVATLSAAAQVRDMPLVGFVNSQSPDGWRHFVASFERGLGEGGLTKGGNVTVEYRWAAGDYSRLPGLIGELIQRRANILVVTGGPDPARAAKAATSTIPIVFTTGPDPVKLGLVQSLSRPGGNMTGFTLFTRQLNPKRLELLGEILGPGATIGALLNPANSGSKGQLEDLAIAAASARVVVRPYYAQTLAEIETSLSDIKAHGISAIFVASDAYFYANRVKVVTFAKTFKLPAIFEGRDFAVAGGLLSYGVDFVDVYRRAGLATARILKGAKPADMPIEQPAKFELVVNLKTARSLGLRLPPSILVRADEVIE